MIISMPISYAPFCAGAQALPDNGCQRRWNNQFGGGKKLDLRCDGQRRAKRLRIHHWQNLGGHIFMVVHCSFWGDLWRIREINLKFHDIFLKQSRSNFTLRFPLSLHVLQEFSKLVTNPKLNFWMSQLESLASIQFTFEASKTTPPVILGEKAPILANARGFDPTPCGPCFENLKNIEMDFCW